MRKTLYAHQQRFIDKNPDRALLVWETGTGKTLAACEWLKKRTERKAIVVCPKAVVGKWRRDLAEEGAVAMVVTRDVVKNISLAPYAAIVLDEAQDFSSPLFTKQRSARATKIYNHIKDNPDTHVLELTATPIRSTPWNIHTLACYLGKVWNVKEFTKEFFYLTDIYGRMHYELRKGWQKMIRPYVEEIADIVLMRDCVDVPIQHEQVIRVEPVKMPPTDEYLEPSALWYKEHRWEQVTKFPQLRALLNGYRKAIVVCNYTEQIAQYAHDLAKEHTVYVLQGSSKDPDAVIQAARAEEECVFIIQASMGAGFDAAEFSVVIFASLSFKYVDYVQMRGRVKRINNLHENLFIHILAGEHDESVYDVIMKGNDFNVLHEANNV